MKSGFSSEQYLKTQSEHIKERIEHFGGKLYLEFGGKLFDDYHASRVLPGFRPDAKLLMLMQLADRSEIIIAVSAALKGYRTKQSKRRPGHYAYDTDVLRLIGEFRDRGLYVSGVVITQFSNQESAIMFRSRLEQYGVKTYYHYPIKGYPSNNGKLIISDDGFGKNDYIETTRPLVVVTAPGPGSGKMATLPLPALSRKEEGNQCGLCKIRDIPHLEPAPEASGRSGLRGGDRRPRGRQYDRSVPSSKRMEKTAVNYSGILKFSRCCRKCSARSTGKVLINHRPIWALILGRKLHYRR